MIKGFICAVVFCSISFIGVFINKIKKKRLFFYQDFLKYIEYASDSVKNTQTTREHIDSKMLLVVGDDFKSYLKGGELPKYINEKDSVEIKDFFAKFGAQDLLCTLDFLQEAKIKVGEKVSSCADDLKKKGSMIMKLCILGGIALVILLI